MKEKIKKINCKPTLLEIVYNDSEDLKKLATREEFKQFIIEDSLKTIKNAIENNLDKVELFNIFNLSLVIELEKSNYKSVLDKITEYHIKEENYEICNSIKKLQDEI
jgi:hypothetical protein|tara:strand:+ start:2739 stop:3059 length:321 start_codon:yes stop_codon:yes gene_type:complete